MPCDRSGCLPAAQRGAGRVFRPRALSNSMQAHRERGVREEVELRYAIADNRLSIEILDSGRGFDPGRLPYRLDSPLDRIDPRSEAPYGIPAPVRERAVRHGTSGGPENVSELHAFFHRPGEVYLPLVFRHGAWNPDRAFRTLASEAWAEDLEELPPAEEEE
ncbi:MAG: ATP-binding protein [Sphingobacterium sp.]|nr:ATP-binding protein [Sphingobacterium sp.]